MGSRMDLKIEKLYGSRPVEEGVYNEGKVRIEILYYQRNLCPGPVPGGFVVARSRGYCKAFMVDRSSTDFMLSYAIFHDALVALCSDFHLKEKLLYDANSAIRSLPDPMVVNGTRIMPELLIRIEIETRTYNISSHNDVSATITPSRNLRIVPASKLRINRLKRIRVSSMGAMLERDWCCVLCLESATPNSDLKVIRLPCKHVFHDNCIVKWLLKSNSCPLCRSCV